MFISFEREFLCQLWWVCFQHAEAQNLSDWDNISTLQRYQILLADAWEWNQRIVLSCFRRASTVVFNPQGNQHLKGSAIQMKSKGRCLCQRDPSKRKEKKLVWTTRIAEGTDSSAGHPEESWTSSVVRTPDELGTVGREDQHLGKPELTAAGTGCVQMTLTLNLQPKRVACCSSHFVWIQENLLEAQHEASTWWKN